MIGATPNRPAWIDQPAAPDRPRWWSYALVAIVSGLYLFLFVRVQWRIGDEGDILNGALAVSEGRVPYRDFFDLRGPASFYWLGLFFRMFGASWTVARIHLLLTGIATSVLVYHLTRRVYGGTQAVLPWALVTIVSIPNWPAPHHHWDSNLFALAAVALFFSATPRESPGRLFGSGLLAGVTSCFIYQKGFFLLASFALVLMVARLRHSARPSFVRAATTILAGYFVVGLCVLAWFQYIGGLSSLVDTTIRYPLATYIDANRLPYAYHLTALTVESVQLLRTTSSPVWQLLALSLMLPMLLIAVLPVLVGLLLLLRLFVRSDTEVSTEEIGLVTVGFALCFSEFHRRDIMHLIYGAPVLLVAAGFLWTRLARRAAFQRLVSIPLIVTLLVMGAGLGIRAYLASERVQTRRGPILLPSDDPALRFLLSDRVARGDYVFVYPYYPTYYFLADVRNPTRFGELTYGPGDRPYFTEAIAAIEAHRVKYILWDTVVEGENLKEWFPEYRHPPPAERWMDLYIHQHYRQVDILNGFRLMERIEGSG